MVQAFDVGLEGLVIEWRAALWAGVFRFRGRVAVALVCVYGMKCIYVEVKLVCAMLS